MLHHAYDDPAPHDSAFHNFASHDFVSRDFCNSWYCISWLCTSRLCISCCSCRLHLMTLFLMTLYLMIPHLMTLHRMTVSHDSAIHLLYVLPLSSYTLFLAPPYMHHIISFHFHFLPRSALVSFASMRIHCSNRSTLSGFYSPFLEPVL